ncbi:hypothetical protein [Frankia sp. CiP3]|uniref:hypothetical protein n=1 Tax=Frankia sp. CiP3 TaxID=2880971 RepID=UPI001EF42726|nr:hypothetical protein [Frankia sp. CiP3]
MTVLKVDVLMPAGRHRSRRAKGIGGTVLILAIGMAGAILIGIAVWLGGAGGGESAPTAGSVLSATAAPDADAAQAGRTALTTPPRTSGLPSEHWTLDVLYASVGMLVVTVLILPWALERRAQSRQGDDLSTRRGRPSRLPLLRPAVAGKRTPAGRRGTIRPRQWPRPTAEREKALATDSLAPAVAAPVQRDSTQAPAASVPPEGLDRVHVQPVVVIPAWQPVEPGPDARTAPAVAALELPGDVVGGTGGTGGTFHDQTATAAGNGSQ